MFTDMVGYSALTERDESLALRLLDEHRRIVRPLFSACGGREIKNMADGFLVEFGSAVDAVRCAVRIQEEMSGRNAKAEHPVLLRIGIHVGDVAIHGDDVLGSGVNIASRIERLSEAGGICLSEDVARQVRNKLPIELASIGRPPLKNISEPVEVYKVVLETASGPVRGVHERRQSLAVLPFVNMSADPENEYFSDGLTEDVLTQISKVKALKVISRTSVMQYKNTSKNLRTIGRELGVSNLLEGSVRKIGNRVRITAQLIDAERDEHLWAENYDHELQDIFAVQSEVADKIATALKAAITPDERAQIDRPPTKSIEAYEHYLKGRYLWNKRTREGLMKGIAAFEEALRLDPGYSRAYAGIADCYIQLGIFEFLPPAEAFPKAREAARKALDLDPDLADARAAIGLIHFQYDWDWEAAERALSTAAKQNPNYATAHHYFADYLKGMGRFDEAYEQIRLAKELDPLSLAIASGVGHVLYLSRKYDEAIVAYRAVLELDPSFVQARLWFGRPFLQKGMYEEAIAELRQADELSGGSTISTSVLAHAYASAGRREEALKLLDVLLRRREKQYVACYFIGLVYVGLGDSDKAFEWLNKAREERSAWLAWVMVEPRFDSLRSDPRWGRLLKDIGFPTS